MDTEKDKLKWHESIEAQKKESDTVQEQIQAIEVKRTILFTEGVEIEKQIAELLPQGNGLSKAISFANLLNKGNTERLDKLQKKREKLIQQDLELKREIQSLKQKNIFGEWLEDSRFKNKKDLWK